jgi:hypothetical protein
MPSSKHFFARGLVRYQCATGQQASDASVLSKSNRLNERPRSLSFVAMPPRARDLCDLLKELRVDGDDDEVEDSLVIGIDFGTT